MDAIIKAPPMLQDTIISQCHPAWWLALYRAGHLSIDAILQLVDNATVAKIRLHSAGGRMYGKVANVAHVLSQASEIDRMSDLTSITRACNEGFVCKMITRMLRKMKGQLSGSRSVKSVWPCIDYALIHRPPGTYLRFSETFLKCDETFDGQRSLMIRFNRRNIGTTEFDINGRMVYIPVNTRLVVYPKTRRIGLYYDSHNPNVGFRNPPMVGLIESNGSAVFTRQGLKLEDLVKCWEDEDALSVADMIGVACSHCIWCDRELTDDTSVRRGSGPVCAKRYNPILLQMSKQRKQQAELVRSIGAQPTGEKRKVLFPRHATASSISLPPKVAEASSLLSGLLECEDEPDDALIEHLRTKLGVDAEALDILEQMLERPGWFPIEQSCVVRALLAAHALGLPTQEKLLSNLLVFDHGLVEDPQDIAQKPEVVIKAQEAFERLHASGEVRTTFKTGKRKREQGLSTALYKAIDKGWAKECRDLLAIGAMDPPEDDMQKLAQYVSNNSTDPEVIRHFISYGVKFTCCQMVNMFFGTGGKMHAEFLTPEFDAMQFLETMMCYQYSLDTAAIKIALDAAPEFRFTEDHIRKLRTNRYLKKDSLAMLMERFEGTLSEETLCLYLSTKTSCETWELYLKMFSPSQEHLKAAMKRQYPRYAFEALFQHGYVIEAETMLYAFQHVDMDDIPLLWEAYRGPVTPAMVDQLLEMDPTRRLHESQRAVAKAVFKDITVDNVVRAMNKLALCTVDQCEFCFIALQCSNTSTLGDVLSRVDSAKYATIGNIMMEQILRLCNSAGAHYALGVYDDVMDILLAFKARGAEFPPPEVIKKHNSSFLYVREGDATAWADVKTRLGFN